VIFGIVRGIRNDSMPTPMITMAANSPFKNEIARDEKYSG
jgi:hypothetical protein